MVSPQCVVGNSLLRPVKRHVAILAEQSGVESEKSGLDHVTGSKLTEVPMSYALPPQALSRAPYNILAYKKQGPSPGITSLQVLDFLLPLFTLLT